MRCLTALPRPIDAEAGADRFDDTTILAVSVDAYLSNTTLSGSIIALHRIWIMLSFRYLGYLNNGASGERFVKTTDSSGQKQRHRRRRHLFTLDAPIPNGASRARSRQDTSEWF